MIPFEVTVSPFEETVFLLERHSKLRTCKRRFDRGLRAGGLVQVQSLRERAAWAEGLLHKSHGLRRRKSSFAIALICTKRRRIPECTSTNQGPEEWWFGAGAESARAGRVGRGIAAQEPWAEAAQIVFFNRLDLYQTPPDSGMHQYKSGT